MNLRIDGYGTHIAFNECVRRLPTRKKKSGSGKEAVSYGKSD